MKKIAIVITLLLLIFFNHILNAEQITANLLREVNFSQTKITATQKIEFPTVNKRITIHKKNHPDKNQSITYRNVKINTKIQHIFSNNSLSASNNKVFNRGDLFPFKELFDGKVSTIYGYCITNNRLSDNDFLYFVSSTKIFQEKCEKHSRILLDQIKKIKYKIHLVDLLSYRKINEVLILSPTNLDLFTIKMDRVGTTSSIKILSQIHKYNAMFETIHFIDSNRTGKEHFVVQYPVTN
jgi:hypothetical protein